MSKNTLLQALLSASMLAGCATLQEPNYELDVGSEQIAGAGQEIAEAVDQILQNDPQSASLKINRALQQDPKSSYLHYINAVSYHRAALLGDKRKLPLAEKGYQQAIQFDAANLFAWQGLGELYLEQKKYNDAANAFAEILLFTPHDPDALYGLAIASYYNQDIEAAAAAVNELSKYENHQPRFLQAASMIFSAAGEPLLAQAYLAELKQATAGEGMSAALRQFNLSRLEGRLADWEYFYKKKPSTYVVEAEPSIATAEAQQVEVQHPADHSNEMVVVDVVIVRTEEDLTTSKGVNMLSGLMLQLGQFDVETTPAYSKLRGQTTEVGDRVTTISRALTIPSVNYSLNIANAGSARNEILARPTLVARNGETAEFFSGVEVLAAAVSGALSGDSVEFEKEVGVRLTLTPEILDDGRVKLDIVAERTFLKTPSNSIEFSLRIETSKTNVASSVVMDFEDTLILSGMSEKETERTRDGVPILQEIPGLQYLFSKATTRDFQKSVLILVTPRRPEYVYNTHKSDGGFGKRNGQDALRARYTDWFKPYPNWSSVFHHVQENELYREFRTGDVTLEHRTNTTRLEDRLSQALKFLYY